MKTNTPKLFALQLGALIALYVSVTSLLVLLFGIVNIKFPDAAEPWLNAESARHTVRGAIATLIVIFPTYLTLTRISNQTRRRETKGDYTNLGRWMVYLSLLVGGAIILGDLVTLILYYLNGEITIRFTLKVLALAIVVGIATLYYFLDVRGYFTKRTGTALYFAGGVSVIVIASLIVGIMNIETPSAVREQRLDTQQVGDLQDLQWRIEEFYRANEALPESLADIYTVGLPPTAPENRDAYRYEIASDTTYQLCATFAQNSSKNNSKYSRSLAYPVGHEKNYNWEHEAGQWCFDRQINEEWVK